MHRSRKFHFLTKQMRCPFHWHFACLIMHLLIAFHPVKTTKWNVFTSFFSRWIRHSISYSYLCFSRFQSIEHRWRIGKLINCSNFKLALSDISLKRNFGALSPMINSCGAQGCTVSRSYDLISWKYQMTIPVVCWMHRLREFNREVFHRVGVC